MVQPVRQHFDFGEYVLLEAVSTVKHEFLNGMVWAMAGGSPDHARVATNISTALGVQLACKRCSVFNSDLRVRVKATGLGTYPDVSVVYGKLELDPEDSKGHTVVNPSAIVEVLSPSTEDYDRGEKLDHYQRIPSLELVVLVALDERRVDVWRRDGSRWTVATTVGSGNADLTAIDCHLSLDAVYRDPLAG